MKNAVFAIWIALIGSLALSTIALSDTPFTQEVGNNNTQVQLEMDQWGNIIKPRLKFIDAPQANYSYELKLAGESDGSAAIASEVLTLPPWRAESITLEQSREYYWAVEVFDDVGVSEGVSDYHQFMISLESEISVSGITFTTTNYLIESPETSIDITWTNQTPSATSTLALYSNGQLIVDSLPLDQVNGSYNWFVDSLTAGSYQVTAVVDKGDQTFNLDCCELTKAPTFVPDTTAPVLNVPNDISLEYANGGVGISHSALSSWINSASASDDMDGAVTVNNDLVLNFDPLVAGEYVITFWAFDSAGNKGDATATVTITEAPYIDTTAPVVTAPSSANFAYEYGTNGVPHSELSNWLNTASATDDVDGNVSVTNNLYILSNPLLSGSYTVAFTATDSSGNIGSATASFTITEATYEDTIAPVVTAPDSANFEYTSGSPGVAHSELQSWLNSATATDNVDGSVAVVNNLSSYPNPLTAGTYAVAFTATDTAGNTGSASALFTVSEVSVADTTAPVVNAPEDASFEYANGSGGIAHSELQNWLNTATATDDVDGSVAVSNNLYLFNNPLLAGSYNVAFTATDTAGNSASQTATLVISEAEAASSEVTILVMGNSLSSAPVGEPSGVSNNVYDEVQQIALETGANFTFSEFIYGGRQLVDHVADSTLMASIPSHDLVIVQGGTGDNSNYANDVEPIASISQDAAFFLRWERAGAIGEYTGLRANIAGAATTHGADLIEIGDVWQDLTANTTIDLFYDLTHQNLNGSYVNALSIYRYLTGESVMGINYTPALLSLDAADILAIKTAVDTHITQFYAGATPNTATISIDETVSTVLEGESITFTATASDSESGDISSSIIWENDLDENLGTGASVNVVMSTPGNRVVTASVVGSDGKTSIASVSILVNPLDNSAPVVQNTEVTVAYNEAFTQKSLLAFVTDDGEIDWSTLALTQPDNGSVVQNSATLSTIDFDYSNTNFIGSETITYTVMDTQGLVSNTGTILITVKGPSTAEPVWLSASASVSTTSPNGEEFNKIRLSTATTNPLIDINGNASGWSINVISPMAGDGSIATPSGTNTGFIPDVLMSYNQYLAGTFQAKFTGLTTGETYSLALTCSASGTTGKVQVVNFGSASGSYEAGGNRNDGVSLQAVADGNGEIALELFADPVNGNGYACISGFILTQSSSGSTNQSPEISDQSLSVTQGDDLDIVLGPLQDADGDVLSYQVTGSDNFEVGSAANTIRYNSTDVGQETLTVTVSDGNGGADIATITITVEASGSNSAPVVENTAVTITYNSALTQKSLLEFVSDDGEIDWSTLVLTQPENGSVIQNSSNLSTIDFNYANTNFSGSDSITYSVEDTQGEVSNTGVITITVLGESTVSPVWVSVGLSVYYSSPNGEKFNKIATIQTATNSLINIEGNASGWSFDVISPMAGDSTVEALSGTNDGYLPDVLMSNVQYFFGTFQAKFTGLTAGNTYRLDLTGSRTDGTGRAQIVSFGNDSGTFEAGNNRNDGVSLQAVADANGEITVEVAPAASGGNGYSYLSGFILTDLNDGAVNQPPVISDQNLVVEEGQNLDIVLGPFQDADGDTLSYSITGSNDYIVGTLANSIVFNSNTVGQQVLTVTVSDGNGGTDTATVTVNVTAKEVVVPTNIAYNGWSTMQYTLDGQNTGSSTSPTDDHNPSLYTLVGQMYAANGITGYAHDFQFLPQGSDYIDGTDALENINTTSATVAILSAYGSTSGITMEPDTANAAGGWIDRMVNAAQAAEARNIKPIMYQAWGDANTSDKFPNAKINTDALQAKHGMLVVRTAEIVQALGELNSTYITNTTSSGGKYAPPVTHLYSGDTSDNFHGSYALAYANALATFKCLTGISAADNQFVIPSGGNAGTQYGMSQQFISDIIAVVDNVQKESLVSGLAEGAAPIATDFLRDAEHNVELVINIATAAAVLDDVNIIPENFTISSINQSHFDLYNLNNNIFRITASNDYTGTSDVVFNYTDADNQIVEFTMTVNIVPEIVIEPQEVIIGFGLGDWTSFGGPGNLYNHMVTETGEVINGIRGFSSLATQGNLQDSNGNGIGSITSLTSGNLSGPGFAANVDPVVTHYGPYTALYAGLSVAPKGTSVSFSINGLEASTAYRVNMAGRYPSDNTNIVNVDVNGVLGQYDSNSSNITEYEKVVETDKTGKLLVVLSSDGTTAASNWGISYVHLNKITDGTPADIPVAPTFTQHPESVSVTEGASVTFSVAVSGVYSLQWYRDGNIINGETATSYTITTSALDSGAVFTVKATNKGGTTTSEPATLTLLTDAPEIVQQPVSTITVMDTNKLSLSVVATGAVGYQWKKDGVDILGETSDSINLPVSESDNGSIYTVVVSNPFGSVESNGTTLTVSPLLQQYWFSFGRSDGASDHYDSGFNNQYAENMPKGSNGEYINYMRSFPESPVSHSGIFKDIIGDTTDLNVSFTSTGSNTAAIGGWGAINSDILQNSNVQTELSNKSWLEHTELYSSYIYLAADHEMTFEFTDGGLVAGEEWQVQILGTHYQDENRPVDVLLNGSGAPGNLQVGSWDNIAIYDQTVIVDSSGKIQLKIAPQINANINAIRLIKTGN